MAEKFPRLKARPEWMPWALECIRTNAGDYRGMENCIVARWRSLSQRKKEPSPKNSLRAVFGPTMRHLGLIMGEKDEIKLAAKAEELIKTYKEQGESAYKKAFAKHLLKLDKDLWVGVVFELQDLGKPISRDAFLLHLQEKYPNCEIDRDKLNKLLIQYDYTGLIMIEGKLIYLREPLLQNLVADLDRKPSSQELLLALIKAYKSLKSGVGGSAYVPIPEIRNEVCKNTGIWPEDFNDYLRELPKETPEYLIHLTEPMVRKPDGIRIGGKYLYYFAIYEKG